jgi:hypothetical protein
MTPFGLGAKGHRVSNGKCRRSCQNKFRFPSKFGCAVVTCDGPWRDLNNTSMDLGEMCVTRTISGLAQVLIPLLFGYKKMLISKKDAPDSEAILYHPLYSILGIMHAHMYACTHVHMYACTHVHMYACTHVHVV